MTVFLQSAHLTSATCYLFAKPKMLYYFPPFFLCFQRYLRTISVILCPKFCIVFPRWHGDHNVSDLPALVAPGATSWCYLPCCVVFQSYSAVARQSSIHLSPCISFLICGPVIYDCLELQSSLQCPVTLVTLLPMHPLPSWPLGQSVDAASCSAYVRAKPCRLRTRVFLCPANTKYLELRQREADCADKQMLRVRFVCCLWLYR